MQIEKIGGNIRERKNGGNLKVVEFLFQDQRANNLPTIPSTIEEELKINPFMRVE